MKTIIRCEEVSFKERIILTITMRSAVLSSFYRWKLRPHNLKWLAENPVACAPCCLQATYKNEGHLHFFFSAYQIYIPMNIKSCSLKTSVFRASPSYHTPFSTLPYFALPLIWPSLRNTQFHFSLSLHSQSTFCTDVRSRITPYTVSRNRLVPKGWDKLWTVFKSVLSHIPSLIMIV